MTRIAWRLRCPQGVGLDGHIFLTQKEADEWIAQPIVKDCGYRIERVEQSQSNRRCGCCGAFHWRTVRTK